MLLKHISATVCLALIITLTGCKKEAEVTPGPVPQTLTARAGADQNVVPVQSVTLDGSASTGNGTLDYQWAVVRKPSNSTLVLGQTQTVKPVFTPDIVGYYEFELTVTQSGTSVSGEKSQDRIQVKAEYPTPITLDKDITTRTRLFDRIIDPTKPDYIVAADIRAKADLTIDQDVVVAFQRDKRLSIETDGTISAIGVPDQRIRFTGVEAQKSYWPGIVLYSASTVNTLAFVDIDYAGSRNAFSGVKAGLALYGTTKTQVTLNNCRFSNNDGYGLYVEEGATLRSFARNSFKGQTEAPVLIDAYNATRLDATSTFTGSNGRDVIEISSSSITGNQEVQWPATSDKTPYRLLGNVAVSTGWTLQPGVTVEVGRDAMININAGGYLSAKGTATDKVTITGAGHTAAYWRGIIIYSVSNLNVIDQADISGGGSAAIASGQRSTLTVYGRGAKVTVKNSRISNSGGYGIMYTSDAELNSDASSANTFTSNAQANTYKL